MLIGTEALDLHLTLMDSGQCFRWIHRDGRYGCVLGTEAVWLWRDPSGIHAEGFSDLKALRHYLDLDRDYAAIARECAALPQVLTAMARYPGLRVLNQPPWEALICAILTANNNVSRITRLTQALCRHFGKDFGEGLYSFPTPQQLSNAPEAELRELKVGYRAPYLIGAARRVCEGFPLSDLSAMPYDEAHRALITLPGVGDKVADCILLFGCGHAEALPVDVWMERVMRNTFDVQEKSRAAIAQRAREMFGPHAGLVQQFLFHGARTGDSL